MIELTFRFYAELNDFLAPAFRHRRFAHVIAAPASVKDAIESLGVPHPEADVIVVNGEPEDFTYRLAHGDDVAVFPVFRSVDVAGLRRVSGDPSRPVRFVVDIHLSKLASLLRLSGFDALLLDDDADVAQVSARDGRVALSRDVGLLKRAIVRHGYWVRHTDPELQLVEVVERFDLAAEMEPFARCLRCNARLTPVDADAVAEQLLPHTRTHFTEFRRCPECERIYWQGSHYSRLAALLERVRRRVS
jgi:uncharacterized protein with PIN domain